MIGLVALTVVTSLVVATISVWLAPVYMAAMLLIFAAPRSPRPADATTTTKADEAPAETSDDAAPPRADGAEGRLAGEADEAIVEASAAVDAVADPPAPAKPRKRKAKAKRGGKAERAAEAPASEPTWIRVGPGKFVRADLRSESPDAETPASSSPEPRSEAEAETEAETTTLAAADPPIEPEAISAADVEPDAEAEALVAATPEDATPASPDDAEPRGFLPPAPAIDDEAASAEPFEMDGIAPSPLDGTFDEERGIAPSALVEPRMSEALPEVADDDEPAPVAEPTDAEPIAEDENEDPIRAEAVVEEAVEAEVDENDAPDDEDQGQPAPIASAATVESSAPARSATGRAPTVPSGSVRPRGLDLARRVPRSRKRVERPCSARRGADARSSLRGRIDHVRVPPRGDDRARRRSDPTGRRLHPRSPPGRA